MIALVYLNKQNIITHRDDTTKVSKLDLSNYSKQAILLKTKILNNKVCVGVGVLLYLISVSCGKKKLNNQVTVLDTFYN